MSDLPVREAATYTTHNKQNIRTSLPSAGFEPAISSGRRPPPGSAEDRLMELFHITGLVVDVEEEEEEE